MLRLVTWNLWWRFGPWRERQSAIEATLADLDADVVCLQETWVEQHGHRQADELGQRLGLQAAVAEVPFWEGVGVANAVLSRWPVLGHETVPLPGDGGGPSRRHLLLARLAAPFGPLTVASTHLHHELTGSLTRLGQVRAVAAAIARAISDRSDDPGGSYPALVGGDLNAVPWSDEVRALTGAMPVAVPGLAFTDCWEHAGDGGPGHTWSMANPYLADSTMPNRRIDYLLVSWPRPRPQGNPMSCRVAGTGPVGGVQPSDHFAVVAELVTPADGSSGQPG